MDQSHGTIAPDATMQVTTLTIEFTKPARADQLASDIAADPTAIVQQVLIFQVGFHPQCQPPRLSKVRLTSPAIYF